MRVATCFSFSIFSIGYLLTIYYVITKKARTLVLLFLGAKIYALCFYHVMEFMSDMPPRNLVPYFAVEGPYLLSIILTLTLAPHTNP